MDGSVTERSGPQPAIYQIKVLGELGSEWSGYFGGLTAVAVAAGDSRPTQTVLTGPVRDQTALRGLLNRIWDFGLVIVAVNVIDGHPELPISADHID